MRILTSDEVEELTEHLASRSDIWLLHNGIWLRQLQKDEFALGLKMRNGLPKGLCAITHKAVCWEQDEVDAYVEWLLEKYTAYGQRKLVLELLESYGVSEQLDVLSRDLCNLQGESFVRKYRK